VTVAEIVLDASALIRGLQRTSEAAAEYVRQIVIGDLTAHVPDLVVAETTNAALRLLRSGRMTRSEARELIGAVQDLPVAEHRTATHAQAALAVAVDTGLSAYDAFYAVLSDVLELPLVTADRTLAAAVGRAVLVT
jgi:predicted nucleic acid-binding protein